MNEAACPELGLHQDRQSYRNYASSQNCCYHCVKSASVSFSHQEEYCLTSQFEKCPIFQSDPNCEFPIELQGKITQAVNRENKWRKYLLVGLGLGFILFIIFRILNSDSSKSLNYLQTNATLTPTELQQVIPQATSLATGIIDPASTVGVLSTADSVAVENASSKVTVSPPVIATTAITGLVIHQVLDGESLEYLSEKYNTTPAAIKAINFGLPSPIWTGWTLVIPQDKSDASDLPVFEVLNVPESITVDQLIQQKNCDPVKFREYNTLQNDLISAGQWILIPRDR